MNLNLTLAFQVLFFIIFVWFSKRYVWTPIIGALNERKTKIADGLAAAEKGQMAEQEGRQKAEEVIGEAKQQAGEIISKAEKYGNELVEQAKQNAREEEEKILTAARAEIDTEMNRARESLRQQVGELAVAGARQILKKEVDASAHAKLLNDLAARL
ncbi:MAG: F0F1 ATP synthase subunit B [Gammaproteobacteria bacterium]|nr:F0F1 ATP synthase subunit B [Gammaproteobacteria bacterium]MCY4219736.1 F0F1 ATP synthase subunit B [Gammaproteobacteria bacterium]MCY4276199.1 F0F1 ATP synthase subunit B [Gammaproteobacteria bacterium]